MLKKLFVISTVAMIMFSPMAFARGGKGNGNNGKAYSGSIGKGNITQIQTQTRIQTQIRDKSDKGTAATNGTGDKTQDRVQKRDGSCNN